METLDKSTTVCFTGHRYLGKDEAPHISEKLDLLINRLVGKGYRTFLAGGALGFDTLAAKRVVEAKETVPDVKLILVLPCRDQTKMWTDLSRINEYRELKDTADDIIYIQTFYDRNCMMKRNMFLVDSSSMCVAYFNGKPGGTSNTVNYANKTGVPVLNLFSGNAADDNRIS
ncbi:MAG: DUF1273 family protein [Clostridia bacterium]|nr:DUF1273 family protein [Clostridia bacterium]